MNKYLFLLIISSTIIVSCSKKSDPPTQTVSPINGKWHYLADTTAEYSNGTLICNCNTDPGSFAFIQFNNDFTGTSQLTEGSAGDTNSYVGKFTYKLSGNTLIVTYPSQKIGGELFATTIDTGVIKSNTGNKLFIQYNINYGYNGAAIHYLENQYLAK